MKENQPKKEAYIWYDVVYSGLIEPSPLSWARIWVCNVLALAEEGWKVCGLERLDEGHVRCWRWVIEGVCGGNEQASSSIVVIVGSTFEQIENGECFPFLRACCCIPYAHCFFFDLILVDGRRIRSQNVHRGGGGHG